MVNKSVLMQVLVRDMTKRVSTRFLRVGYCCDK